MAAKDKNSGAEEKINPKEIDEILEEAKSELLSRYKDFLIKILKNQGKYIHALTPQIESLASAMRTLDMANNEIDSLNIVTITEESRYGKKCVPHPVFKVAKDAQELITRQMKILGLTAEDLIVDAEEDPMTDLTKMLISNEGSTVKPKR